MKLFSDCSGECCVCACAGGCLAGHGDDDFSPASKKQIIERLDNGKYKDYTEYMKNYLKNLHGYDYDKEHSTNNDKKFAHWIIEDHGFGGQTYRCSECRDCWNDIYEDVSRNDTCPNCGAVIDDDKTVYVGEKVSSIKVTPSPDTYKQCESIAKKIINSRYSNIVEQYEKMTTKLVQVSGYDIEKLIELFAAGYTLQPPDYKDITRI